MNKFKIGYDYKSTNDSYPSKILYKCIALFYYDNKKYAVFHSSYNEFITLDVREHMNSEYVYNNDDDYWVYSNNVFINIKETKNDQSHS